MISFHKYNSNERGQGLVEYALILTLVAVVVIAVLLTLGPAVGMVFSRINTALGLANSGVITGVSAERTGHGSGNDITVTVTVSKTSSVTVSDSQNASPKTTTCSGSCTVTLNGAGPASGTVTVTASAGGTATTTYAAKN